MGGERGGAGRKIKMGWKWNGGILSSRQERGRSNERQRAKGRKIGSLTAYWISLGSSERRSQWPLISCWQDEINNMELHKQLQDQINNMQATISNREIMDRHNDSIQQQVKRCIISVQPCGLYPLPR